eukprot:Hpha_TRINITY_DN8917_c0_g1::TRINITY_DN8917_c0_g1_i1::g.80720::m.80720
MLALLAAAVAIAAPLPPEYELKKAVRDTVFGADKLREARPLANAANWSNIARGVDMVSENCGGNVQTALLCFFSVAAKLFSLTNSPPGCVADSCSCYGLPRNCNMDDMMDIAHLQTFCNNTCGCHERCYAMAFDCQVDFTISTFGSVSECSSITNCLKGRVDSIARTCRDDLARGYGPFTSVPDPLGIASSCDADVVCDFTAAATTLTSAFLQTILIAVVAVVFV